MYVYRNCPSPAVYVELSYLLLLAVTICDTVPGATSIQYSTNSSRVEQWLVVRCWLYYYSFSLCNHHMYPQTTCQVQFQVYLANTLLDVIYRKVTGLSFYLFISKHTQTKYLQYCRRASYQTRLWGYPKQEMGLLIPQT